jgi:hypothetical protein
MSLRRKTRERCFLARIQSVIREGPLSPDVAALTKISLALDQTCPFA